GRKVMKAGERFGRYVKGQEVDRLPVIEWAPFWTKTLERWGSEGLDATVRGLEDILRIQRYFGLDGCLQTYFSWRSNETPEAKSFGGGIIKNAYDYGRIKKTIFKNPSLYYGKEFYEWLNKVENSDGDTINWFTVEGFFWVPRELFGVQNHFYSFYDQPELLNEICSDYADWLEKVFEFIGNTFNFDFMTFAEDMSYNNGPMISADIFNEFLAPYYKKVIPVIKKCGIPVVIDSDGDITDAVDWYHSVGADGMLPLERRAGVDVSVYIKKHPEMFFIGHFDKTCMSSGEKAMRDEFERIMPSWQKGKVIPSVDHQTPPDVDINTYKLYVSLLKEYSMRLKR
ncbi:MAG: hypothetical protein J6Z34_00320, partial [Clostridia bacterium]|nr:hypothetical protein [Clostridia bacterium]